MPTLSEEIADLKASVVKLFTGSSSLREDLETTRGKLTKAEADLSAEVARASELTKRVEALDADVKAKDAEIIKLKGEVETANTAKAAAETAKAEAEKKVTAAEEKVKETEASTEKRAGLKAQQIEAGRGVTNPVREENKDNPAKDKENGGLKGMARVRAAIREQLGLN